MGRGVAVEAGCCCWLLWERTGNVIITRHNTGGIYSNNLVRTDHVCSCLVTSAAQEWINQSHDDRYPVYRFAAYQRDTSWSYHRLCLVTGIHFTRSVGDCSSSTRPSLSTKLRWPAGVEFFESWISCGSAERCSQWNTTNAASSHIWNSDFQKGCLEITNFKVEKWCERLIGSSCHSHDNDGCRLVVLLG